MKTSTEIKELAEYIYKGYFEWDDKTLSETEVQELCQYFEEEYGDDIETRMDDLEDSVMNTRMLLGIF